MEGKQKLSAAGFHIHQLHAVFPIVLNNLSKIPWQNILFLVSAVDMGKIPSVDMGNGFFLFPDFF